jgi:uncharacterized iron-regulated membrane protein
MRAALRRRWLQLHRWCGLTLGLLLALAALSGAALVVLKPLDRWWHPQLFAAPRPELPPAPLQASLDTLRAAYGEDARFTIRPPRAPGETLQAYVDGRFHGQAFLDPATGRLLGQREDHEGLFNLVFELHSSLLLEDGGRALLATAAAGYLLLLASGLVLWWPARWGQALRVGWRAGAPRLVPDLHKAGGVLAGLLVAVSAGSGAWMAWKPLPAWVNRVGASPAPAVPRIAPWAGDPAPLDAMAAQLQAMQLPGTVGYIVVAGRGQPVRWRLRLQGDPHPNGLSSAWFHPGTGALLALHPWHVQATGTRHTTWIYPLHTGQLGGTAHRVLVAATGLAGFALGGTGLWMWARRRRTARRRPARA